jgi:hypothetical protein
MRASMPAGPTPESMSIRALLSAPSASTTMPLLLSCGAERHDGQTNKQTHTEACC